MISFDQVLLLEQKVESAVAKIAQLNAENAALRTKCAELTNALSAKTEQFLAFQTDQNKIEEGILKALERLNAVENAVISASQTQQDAQVSSTSTSNSTTQQTSEQNTDNSFNEEMIEEQSDEISVPIFEESTPIDPETMVNSATDETGDTSSNFSPSNNKQEEQGQFDIF